MNMCMNRRMHICVCICIYTYAYIPGQGHYYVSNRPSAQRGQSVTHTWSPAVSETLHHRPRPRHCCQRLLLVLLRHRLLRSHRRRCLCRRLVGGCGPVHVHTHTDTHSHTRTHTHTHMWHSYVCTYIHTCMHTHIHTYIHTCIHTCIHTHIHAHTHIHSYIRTHTHTYTHMDTHTHTYVYIHTCIFL